MCQSFQILALNNSMDMKLGTTADASNNKAIYVKVFIVWK